MEAPLSRAALLERLAGLIARIRLAHPTRVAFDGPDAAGKTTLATSSRPSSETAAAR